jgi:hypothetical protein
MIQIISPKPFLTDPSLKLITVSFSLHKLELN